MSKDKKNIDDDRDIYNILNELGKELDKVIEDTVDEILKQ